MKATICDRCSKAYFEENKRGKRKYTMRVIKPETTNKQMSRGAEIDLCETCYAELVNWFEKSQNKQIF